ncbi:hypothetical protein SODALDRAFT_354743 [Sodiomyces alkalinus F11]|uniref:Uncharacterized protein n=1 Tax=Sodiomyces alkalinus (strain CBS 110278 / VKM F-3762 / F11) TaxID=1314773 RepID=A0A3N2Q712_SODAK|nr:hypothetical protein SODALDRAFT_354743 [Sodiomyces alkalinus F11]ROT42579.1 hypothetical protein SODALDRAFT_354743 [Sodiomyces alkalinus F11]
MPETVTPIYENPFHPPSTWSRPHQPRSAPRQTPATALVQYDAAVHLSDPNAPLQEAP